MPHSFRPPPSFLPGPLLGLIVLVLVSCCHQERSAERAVQQPAPSTPHQTTRQTERSRMVKTQLVARGIASKRVLAVMKRVPRHRFVPIPWRRLAYSDRPLPIGFRQTISQPYVVAFMTEALDVGPQHRVLEIGTGSGYQTAVLAELCRHVYTIEIVTNLAKRSAKLLKDLGYKNISARHGDGYHGWPKAAPFDRILLTAAPPKIPKPLVDQLAAGGFLVAPVGRHSQKLVRWKKTARGLVRHDLLDVRFVPMTGKAQSN
jgi:protein-L-isoaspartate(D-aspartate) O-methyltransferase